MATQSRTNHLLVIAINHYENGIDELFNAANDAMEFVEVLHNEYQFLPENTVELYNEDATKDNIFQQFDRLIDKLTKDDNLVLYFSGHGEYIERTKRGYWLPVDAELGKRSTYLSNTDVTDFFRALKTFHIFSIVDSCFSGALFRSTKGSHATRMDTFESRWLLTAGRTEPVADGFENSPFAASLLSYLRNTNADFIPVARLCQDVLEGVLYNAEKQTPLGEPLHNVGHQGGQFIFYKKGVSIEVAKETKTSGATKGGTAKEETPTPEISEPTPPPQPKANTYKDIRDLKKQLKKTATTDLKACFDILDTIFVENSRNGDDLLMLQSRYNNIARQQRLGVITSEQFNINFNRILVATQDLINKMEKEDVKSSIFPTQDTTTTLEQEGMSKLAKLIVRKLNKLEERLLIETDESVKFKLEYEIDELKEKLKQM